MKDLINRLRRNVAWIPGKNYAIQLEEIMDEAADAIEKLEAENAALKATISRQEEGAARLGLVGVAMRTEIDALKAELAARWIPVTERLPKAYDEVMVWPHPSNNSMTADINTIGTWRSSEYESGFGWTENVCYPTHWMPLPAAPEAKP